MVRLKTAELDVVDRLIAAGIASNRAEANRWALTRGDRGPHVRRQPGGPALGGFPFELGGAVPFLGDAVSYLVSTRTVSRIRRRFRPERTGVRTGLWRGAADGIRRHRAMRCCASW